MHYIFIVNGREDKAALREEIAQQIAALPDAISHEIYATTGPGDATRFVREYASNTDEMTCFVACGGDGTIGEVASGLVGATGKCFAVLAFGTGNDFVKYYPGRDFCSVADLVAGTPTTIDILKVNDRYSVNVTNFGFDSIVGSVGGKLAAKGVKNPYRLGIVAAILAGRFNRISVSADGEKLGGRKLLLCTLANCHYVGGEFFCAPKAQNDDGLIDVCLLRAMTLAGFLSILPVYTAGQHLDNPKFADKVIYRQARHIDISAPKTIQLCLDGEMYAGQEFAVDILPKAVTLIVPQGKKK